MNNNTNVISASSAPSGISTARDCEYVVYSSVAGSVGHRLVYHNTSVAEDSFYNYTGAADTDYLQIIVQGAVASTAVYQLIVSY